MDSKKVIVAVVAGAVLAVLGMNAGQPEGGAGESAVVQTLGR